ncbi:MAG: hypothetical protein HQL50_01930 [Magnetococcales bacterium]|nr:hypothetical protein [Magnetococcales bacterium]
MAKTKKSMSGSDKSRRLFRINLLLPLAFVVLIGITTLINLLPTHLTAMEAFKELSRTTMERTSRRTLDKTVDFLETAANVVRVNQGLLHPKRTHALNHYLPHFNSVTWNQLVTHDHFSLIYYGDEQGNHWVNKRERDGSIRTRVIRRLDDSARSRSALGEALKLQKSYQSTKDSRTRNRIASLVAPVLETSWYKHDHVGRHKAPDRDHYFAYDPRLRPWYRGAKNKDGLYWHTVYSWLDEYEGESRYQLGITVSAPVKDGSKLLGVTAVDIVLKDISDFLATLTISENGRPFIVDAKGDIVGLPNYEEVLNISEQNPNEVSRNTIGTVSDKGMVAAFHALQSHFNSTPQGEIKPFSKPVLLEFEHDGEPFYGFFQSFKPVYDVDWTIGIVAPQSDFLGRVEENMLMTLSLTLAVVILVIGVGAFVGIKLARPIDALSSQAQRVGRLDLRSIEFKPTRFAEIYRAQIAFKRMRKQLHAMLTQITDRTVLLDEISEGVGTISVQMNANSGDLQETVQSVNEVTDDVKHSMESITDLTGQMVSRMSDVIDSSSVIEGNMHKMAQAAEESGASLAVLAEASQMAFGAISELIQSKHENSDQLEKVVTSLAEITDDIGAVRRECETANIQSGQANDLVTSNADLMDNLEKAIRNIGKVLDMINDIADQTNMLALNAAIEAAGAGDAGKGFSVVANSVKTLAVQTSEATRTISKNILDIQNRASEVGASSNHMLDIIGKIGDSTESIRYSVDSQSDLLNEIDGRMESIAVDIRQMTEKIDHSFQRIQAVTTTVGEISNGITQVSSEVMEASQGVQGMSSKISEAAESSHEINNNVSSTSEQASLIAERMQHVNTGAQETLKSGEQLNEQSLVLVRTSSELKKLVQKVKI